MSEIRDIIVVGSGCSGAIAALTLAGKGQKVTMVDAGEMPAEHERQIPAGKFSDLRKNDMEQHRYFLDQDPLAITGDDVSTGAQLTPPRKFMVRKVKELLPLLSDTFFPMESLAYGGLGNGWGLGCCVFSETELLRCGLDPVRMKQAYQFVSDAIGISGSADDAAKYTCGDLNGIHKPVHMDRNAETLFSAYYRKKEKLNRKGFYMGRPALALITEDKDERNKYAYRDLDFYSDDEQSAWRPWITVDRLRKENKVEYIGGKLVLSFEEQEGIVHVNCMDIQTKTQERISCRRLILAPGTLGTARIVLRSSSMREASLPLLCNPYVYIPSIQWSQVGKGLGEHPVGFAQLSLFYDQDGTNSSVSMASIYSYHSLMLYRIIRQVPLDMRSSRKILQALLPAFTIYGIHFPVETAGKFRLNSNSFYAEYPSDVNENARLKNILSMYTSAMRTLGCFPITKVDPGMGSSIHYAGTLPFSKEKKEFSLSPDGRLHGTERVYVADGSGFRYLPAKGLTLSLMANAYNVAKKACE